MRGFMVAKGLKLGVRDIGKVGKNIYKRARVVETETTNRHRKIAWNSGILQCIILEVWPISTSRHWSDDAFWYSECRVG